METKEIPILQKSDTAYEHNRPLQQHRDIRDVIDFLGLICSIMVIYGIAETYFYFKSREWPLVDAKVIEILRITKTRSVLMEVTTENSNTKTVYMRRDTPFLRIGHVYKARYKDGYEPVVNSFWTIPQLCIGIYVLWWGLTHPNSGWIVRFRRWTAERSTANGGAV